MRLSRIGFKTNGRWPRVNEVRRRSFPRPSTCLSSVPVSVPDDSMPLTMMSNNSNNHLSATNDFENLGSDDDLHAAQPQLHLHHQQQQQHQLQQQQQKSTVPVMDVDCYDTSASLLDPQMAAYRAIMSRMVPFANNINGNNSPKRLIKQEPLNNQDESSQGDDSSSSSPLNDRLSP